MAEEVYDFNGVPVSEGEAFLDTPGWYRMKLVEKKEDEKMQINLVFQSVGPSHVGARCTAFVKNPRFASTEQDAIEWKRWLWPWLVRLGMADKDHPERPVSVDWQKKIGWVGVGYLEPNSYIDKNGNEKNGARFKFCSIYPENHADIPPVERIKMGLPLLDWQVDPRSCVEPGKKPKKGGKPAADQGQEPVESEEDRLKKLAAEI